MATNIGIQISRRTYQRARSGREQLRSAVLAALCSALVMAASTAVAAASQESDVWDAADSVSSEPSDDRVIGRVVGFRGDVYAQSPGKGRRLLEENSPVYPGDRLVTSNGAQLGILSGQHYTGLDEDTALTYAMQANGAPVVTLEKGGTRVLNTGGGQNARIVTPGMVAETGARDTSAFAIKEKAWFISMICALEGQVETAAGGTSLVVGQGGCAASKPNEGLYLAGAAAPGLPLLAALPAPVAVAGMQNLFSGLDVAGEGPPTAGRPDLFSGLGVADEGPPLAGAAASRFAGPDVAAPAGFSGSFGAFAPIASTNNGPPRHGCDVPGTICNASTVARTPTPIIIVVIPGPVQP